MFETILEHIGTLTYSLQVCRPIVGSVLFSVCAHLAAVLQEIRDFFFFRTRLFDRVVKSGALPV